MISSLIPAPPIRSISKHPYNRIRLRGRAYRLISRVSPVSIFNFRLVRDRCNYSLVSRFNTPRARFTSTPGPTHRRSSQFQQFHHPPTMDNTRNNVVPLHDPPLSQFARAYFQIWCARHILSNRVLSSFLLRPRESRRKIVKKKKKKKDTTIRRRRTTTVDAASLGEFVPTQESTEGSVWLRKLATRVQYRRSLRSN